MENKKIIKNKLKLLINDILSKDYDSIVKNGYISSDEIEYFKKVIEQYPIPLTVPPEDAFERLEYIEITSSKRHPKKWHLDFDLWDEAGLGDLTLSFEITETEKKDIKIAIKDLRVL